MDVIPDLPAGRVGMLIVVHHVVADGLRGVDVIARLLGLHPDDGVEATEPWHPASPPTAGGTDSRSKAAGWLAAAAAHLCSLAGEVGSSAPATVLTGPIGTGRQLAVVRHELDTLSALAHEHDVTVNDLLLGAVTRGLRDL